MRTSPSKDTTAEEQTPRGIQSSNQFVKKPEPSKNPDSHITCDKQAFTLLLEEQGLSKQNGLFF